jgi:hypothetical protein
MRHRRRSHDGRPAAGAKRRSRRGTRIVLLVLIHGAVSGLPAADVREASADSEFLAGDLEGQDEEIAALHARRLIESIASKEGKPGNPEHLNYLLEKLNPALIAEPRSDLLAAGRILDALEVRIRMGGPPFPGAGDILLPLVGLGPPAFRDGVVKALEALVRHDLASGRAAGISDALAVRLSGSRPPAPAFVEDASRILWETDGKVLVGALVKVLSAASASIEGSQGSAGAHPTACLEVLRSRLGMDFPAIEGWERWWEEVRSLPFERIVADAERRSLDEHLASWRKLLRRLRETGDGERLLLALEDTLETAYAPDVRVAAVGALGDFADWLLELRVPEATTRLPGAESPGDSRARLLARAVRLLADLEEPKGSRIERADVLTAGMAALRHYQLFLEKEPRLLADVAAIVSRRLHALSMEDLRASREQLLETLRLAGALRVSDALGFVEGLLGNAFPEGEEDLEVLTAAAAALGRLSEKGLGEGSSKLLIANFRKMRSGPEKAIRELRRTCINALLSGSDSPSVRAGLLEFYRELLDPAGDRDLRIPALLGLGTLARQKEPGALDALARVLEKDASFEPAEVIAAMDSIAYVGGEPSLSVFLDYGPRARDKAVEEHLVKKIAGLIEAGDATLLASILEKLEARALEEESGKHLELAIAIAEEPAAKSVLAADKLAAADPVKLRAWWGASFALLRTRDALGDDDGVVKLLASLSQAFADDASLREKTPEAAAEVGAIAALLTERQAAATRLARPAPADDPALIEEMKKSVSPERAPAERWRAMRWIRRKIAALPDPSERARVAGLWRNCLAAPANDALWQGLPESCRARQLAGLASLEAGGE